LYQVDTEKLPSEHLTFFDEQAGQDDPVRARETQLSTLRSLATTEELRLVRVNPDALKTNDQIDVPIFPNGAVRIQRSSRELDRDEIVTWLGQASGEEPGSTVIAVNGDQVTASIQTLDGLYRLRPLADGLHALIKVDLERLPPEHPPSFDEQVSRLPRSMPDCVQKSDEDASITDISVLVAYTPAVQRKVFDIRGFVRLAFAESNTSYRNSGIRIRLVPAPANPILVNYREAGSFEKDLAAFRNMKDIAKIRRETKANVGVLLIDNRSACGQASGILATKETAFAVVYHDCATGYYSFAHEIGHLQGARHNPEMDAGTTPFPYGHGYMDQTRMRRTIMSYECPNLRCRRMPQWSRPSDWGSVRVNNNARVLNQTAKCIAGFK
jgi:hypothetical protein